MNAYVNLIQAYILKHATSHLQHSLFKDENAQKKVRSRRELMRSDEFSEQIH
jgi:negative regulator of replication initiation